MIAPAPKALFATLDATWPPLHRTTSGCWCLRNGDGGGKRTSAATLEADLDENEMTVAEDQMRAMGQDPLFMVRDGDARLDALLETRGYTVVDPTQIYAVPAREIAKSYPMTTTIPTWPPFAIQREIWAAGGVTEARRRVMDRAVSPKTSLLGRLGDTPGGTVFVAVSERCAMLHALEVRPSEQRQGLGEILVRATAQWAMDQGAEWLTLAVTRANKAANALYAKLGMTPVAAYHYRRAPEVSP